MGKKVEIGSAEISMKYVFRFNAEMEVNISH